MKKYNYNYNEEIYIFFIVLNKKTIFQMSTENSYSSLTSFTDNDLTKAL